MVCRQPSVATASKLGRMEIIEDSFYALGISSEEYEDGNASCEDEIGDIHWLISMPRVRQNDAPILGKDIIPSAKVLDDVFVSGMTTIIIAITTVYYIL